MTKPYKFINIFLAFLYVFHPLIVLATTDYNDVGQTSFGSVSTNSSEGEVAKSVTFNATGLSYISKTGYTHLSLRAADDINNSAPVSSNNHATFYTSEETGTTKDPYLEIIYVSGTIDTSAGNVSQDYTYTYDQVGNITQIVDASDNHAAKTLTFIYDDLNRLTTASSTLAASSTNFLYEYDYDPIGNIEDKTGQGSYEYKGNEGSSYANAHAATKIGSQTLSYDNNGNLTSDGAWNYAWDYQNRLTEAGSPTATSTFTYDHTGQRVSLDDGPNTTYYPSRLYNVTGATTTKHVYAGDVLVATVHGTDIYTVHTDHLGSPVLLVAENGGMIQLQDFFPYGELRLNHSNNAGYDEQRKYTGHEYDSNTGLTYMGARYYPTQYGRILSQDPVSLQTPEKFLDDPQQMNMYAYSRNNPLIFVDPTGERLQFFAKSVFGIGVHMFAKVTLDFAGARDIYMPEIPAFAGSFTLGAYADSLNPFTNKLRKGIGYAGKHKGLGSSDFYADKSDIISSAEVFFDDDEQEKEFIDNLMKAYRSIGDGQDYRFLGNTFGKSNGNSSNFIRTLTNKVGLGGLIKNFSRSTMIYYAPGSDAPLPGQGYTIYFQSADDMKQYYKEVEETKKGE